MFKKYFLLILIGLSFGFPMDEADARKRKKRKPKWSVGFTNGYTVYEKKKSSSKASQSWGHSDGQMNPYFSSVELARNFGHFEVGGRVQLMGPALVSPFFKWNIVSKNNSFFFKPSVVLGVVPARLMGGYARLNLGLAVNSYLVLNPFVGMYAWHKVVEDIEYESNNLHINAGFNLNLYF